MTSEFHDPFKNDDDYVELEIQTSKLTYFSGRKVIVHRRTGFVQYVSLLRLLCSHEEPSLRHGYWDRIMAKLSATKNMVKKGHIFVSDKAIEIMVKEFKYTSKGSWGVFAEDGFQQLTEDLHKISTKRKQSVNFSDDVEMIETKKSVKAVKQEQHTKQASSSKQSDMTNRAEQLEERETLLLNQEKYLRIRQSNVRKEESLLLEKELLLVKREEQVSDREKRVRKDEIRAERFVVDVLEILRNMSDYLKGK